MARSVGVELTPAQVRILTLEHAGKTTKILQFQESAIPAGEAPWEERAAAALREACAAAKIPKGRITAALDSGDAILREVSLPFKDDAQVRKTVRFEMESLIHNYTIEQLVVSHYRTGETDKASLLLAAAVPKTVVEKRLKLFQAAGVDPVALDLDIAAVFSAMLHAGAIATDEPILLVHGTPKFTKLVFIEERRPRSIRTIRFSMEGESEASSKPAAADPQPDKMPLVMVSEVGSGFGSMPQERQSALIGILSKEISRFLLANAASASPAHILLSGDFQEEGAARLLEAATRLPVKTVDLAKAVDPAYPGAAPGAGVAVPLGLALKGAGVDPLAMDFRQDEFQYTKRFEALKTTLLVTVELVIVFLAAIALHFYFKKDALEKSLKSVLGAHQVLAENVTGETIADPKAAYPRMAELFKQAAASQGADLPISASAREAWRDLYAAIQKFQQKHGDKTLSDGTLFLEIDTIDIQQTTTVGNETFTLMLRGKIRNLEFASLLKNEVRAMPLFANADFVGSLPTVENDLKQFTLKATKGGRAN